MMVRAELVRLVQGADRALVAATIFWRADIKNAASYERDGYVWWNASQKEIAEMTGLSPDQVARAGKWLTENGLVVAERHQRAGIQDRSYSYRVVTDTPMPRNRDIEAADSPHVEAAESPLLPSTKTLKTTAQRASQMPGDLTWTNAHSLKAVAKGVDVEVEFQKFTDYHLAKGSKFVDWDRAFHTWLNNARPEPGFGQRAVGGRLPSRPSPMQRMQDILNIPDPTVHRGQGELNGLR